MRAMEYTQVQCQCEPMGRWVLVRWCPIHGKRIEPTKHLTDAECAAEYHRACHEFDIAKYGLERDPYPGALNDCDDIGERIDTWHRFARYPHADEVDQ